MSKRDRFTYGASFRYYRKILLLFLAAFLASCATSPSAIHHFEEPKEMEAMISFWEQVYSRWDENEIAFHDNRYLDVVYFNLTLPPGDNERRRATLRHLERELTLMEERVRRGEPLTKEQRHYAALLRRAGGEAALFGAADRVRSQRGLKSRFKRGLEMSTAYLPYFKATFNAAGLPEELAYLPHVESSFVNHALSKVGASGMWQFMRATARSFLPMESGVIDGRLDPFLAAQGAARYLQESYQLTLSWPLAITAYNHGAGGMIRAKEQYGENIGKIVWHYQGPRFGFASRNFYAEFLAAKRIAENPNRYFSGLNYEKPPKIEGIKLLAPITLGELVERSGVSRFELMELNPAWLAGIHTDRAPIPAGVDIWLPKGSVGKMREKHFFRRSEIQP